VFLAGGLAATMVSPATAADPGAVWSTNSHRYEVVTADVTWTSAEAAARAMSWGEAGVCSGYLATITSQGENDFLATQFGASMLAFKWFGGIQPNSALIADGWTWSNGEPWGYTNWNAGEPNNTWYAHHPAREDATAFWYDAKWNDVPRTWLYGSVGGYVVEYDCLGMSVDVKPGSSENTVNGNDHGVIPLAVLTTEAFDAATVNPLTVTMNGAAAKVRGKSMTAGALEDVDGDGDLDLVVQIVDSDGVFIEGSTTATVTALTYDGILIKGFDIINYVP
jgi:hypothetical protein